MNRFTFVNVALLALLTPAIARAEAVSSAPTLETEVASSKPRARVITGGVMLGASLGVSLISTAVVLVPAYVLAGLGFSDLAPLTGLAALSMSVPIVGPLAWGIFSLANHQPFAAAFFLIEGTVRAVGLGLLISGLRDVNRPKLTANCPSWAPEITVTVAPGDAKSPVGATLAVQF